jgi:hypothetical protein
MMPQFQSHVPNLLFSESPRIVGSDQNIRQADAIARPLSMAYFAHRRRQRIAVMAISL